MGLFRSKKIYDEIVCPYCFAKYTNDKVHFRAAGSVEAKPDEILDKWYKAVKNDTSATKNNQARAYNPFTDPGTTKETKFTVGKETHCMVTGFVPQGSSNEIKRRICPYCHNDLPADLGNGQCTVIAVLGYTQIGKTVFINSLIKKLEEIAYKFEDFTFDLVSFDMIERVNAMWKQIKKGELLATDVEYIEPVIGVLSNGARKTVISFYDFPGESTSEQIATFSQRQIENADAMLILFDLTKTATLSESYFQSQINEQTLLKKSLLSSLQIQESELDEIIKSVGATNPVAQSPVASQDQNVIFLKNQLATLDERIAKCPDGPEKEELERKKARLSANYASILQSAQAAPAQQNVAAPSGKQFTDEERNMISQLKQIVERLSQIEKEREEHEFDKSASSWLTATYKAACGADAENDPRPVAVVGTKSDEVYTMVSNNAIEDEKISQNHFILSEDVHNEGYFDLTQGERMGVFVEKQLLARDLPFKNTVKNIFANMHYFAISALGTRYVNVKKQNPDGSVEYVKQLDAKNIHPWRVDEPILWLLYKLGIIEGK